ncbi:hypothetical protein GIB67_042938 [Kingdonia uniflora]|uniref:Uncharacterized protein n=1 Tax=Kingdonia uniflora TaxID=39325 RepID=A0A7J7L628_9MAGN|nr:hypothetical protein GIB67_042938 [Kingdonia uniflora]
MGYSKVEVNDIMEDTYVEEEDEVDEARVVRGLDDVSPQTERENQLNDNVNPENENDKIESELERLKNKMIEKDSKLKRARDDLSNSEIVVEQLTVALPAKRYRVPDRERSRKNKGDSRVSIVQGDVVSISARFRELDGDVAHTQAHVQKGNERLRKKDDLLKKSPAGIGVDRELEELCAQVDEAGLVGHLSPVIGTGDEEDTVAELIEWPRLKGSRVEYPTFSSHVSQGGDYLYLLPDLAKEKKCKRLGDEVSMEYVQGIVKDSRTDGFCCYLTQFDYGLSLPLSNLAKSVMNLIGVCPAQLNFNFGEVIFVCETLNERWAASGSEKRITAKDFLEYYAVKYVTTTNGAYLCSSSVRPCFFNLSAAGRVWNDNPLWVSGINCIVSRKESFIDVAVREGTKLEAVLKELEISRFKRVASKDDKVRRSQAKRRLVGKTSGSMEEKLTTSELNFPLKLMRLNEILDGPVDMATVSSTIVRNLAKRKAIKRGAVPRSVSSVSVDDSSKRRKVISPTKSQEMLEGSDKIAEGTDLRPRFEVEADLLEEQCRAKALEKMVAVMDDEFKKVVGAGKKISQLEGEKNQLEEKLTRERVDFQLEREKEKEPAALKLKQVRAESEAEAIRLVTASTISWNNLAGKFCQLRYTKAEITSFSKENYEEMEIMDEEEEIENSRLRVVDLEGLLEVEKKSSAELQKELDTAREREEKTLLYNVEYAKEYKALISQSRHEAELAEYRIRALNEEISDMKCSIRALNELLLKGEIDLDTVRTNLVVSEADFEKLSSSIVGKDRKLRNSEQICDSLIARLDRLKADLRRLKGKKAQSRADLVEIQAKNKNLVDDLAHAYGNVKRATQREKEMNERINQLCARISESERELRVRELKYKKDLKFELDKRYCEIASGEGSREMKEFLHRKEELVENMRINLANSRQKSIDLTRQMSERIDQLTAELAESKARRWKDNKRAAVTHQAFKELVVHEQEKCDGEVLHQRQLSALVAFSVEEIKFLQVERDLMQDCFSGRTCVCKVDISSIDPIGVMDRGIGTMTAEHIARGRKIVAERASEYMPSRTEIGGSSSIVSPTLVVGGKSTTLPSRKTSRVKKK